EDYSDFVEHPRYGRSPRFTDLDADRSQSLHHSGPTIPGTAVAADPALQSWSPVSIPFYFDMECVCRDCGRKFLFFAEEQKHWYETLGFSLWSLCERCVPCRKKCQGVEAKKRRYAELLHIESPSAEQSLELAECCLALMEAGIFSPRHGDRVRMALNRVTAAAGEATGAKREALRERLKAAERQNDRERDA
ncbi:MAG TPA: zinc-ribbon domain containing protein, partial [Planctomycetia bacterium]|nr:zinc-ribbon domain containing protein [Planctomycetia bacterium]